MVEPNENFVIFLTLFMLSFSLPKVLLLFGAKLLFMLFMLLITFLVLSSKIKLHMNAFLGHLQTNTTLAPLVLLVLFFFSPMRITNLSFGLGFVVFLAMVKLKRVSVLWSCLLSSSYLSQCCLLGTSLLCWTFSLLCHLWHAFYGLKQVPRASYAKFNSTISRLGYIASHYNSTLFLHYIDNDTILLLLYVDDMIIIGDDLSGI